MKKRKFNKRITIIVALSATLLGKLEHVKLDIEFVPGSTPAETANK